MPDFLNKLVVHKQFLSKKLGFLYLRKTFTNFVSKKGIKISLMIKFFNYLKYGIKESSDVFDTNCFLLKLMDNYQG